MSDLSAAYRAVSAALTVLSAAQHILRKGLPFSIQWPPVDAARAQNDDFYMVAPLTPQSFYTNRECFRSSCPNDVIPTHPCPGQSTAPSSA